MTDISQRNETDYSTFLNSKSGGKDHPVFSEHKLKNYVPVPEELNKFETTFINAVLENENIPDAVKNGLGTVLANDMLIKKKNEYVNKFVDDFKKWLLGMSNYNNIRMGEHNQVIGEDGLPDLELIIKGDTLPGDDSLYYTPWGNHKLTHIPEVREYLASYVYKRHAAKLYFEQLYLRAPETLEEAMIFYKYLVKNRVLEEIENMTDIQFAGIVRDIENQVGYRRLVRGEPPAAGDQPPQQVDNQNQQQNNQPPQQNQNEPPQQVNNLPFNIDQIIVNPPEQRPEDMPEEKEFDPNDLFTNSPNYILEKRQDGTKYWRRKTPEDREREMRLFYGPPAQQQPPAPIFNQGGNPPQPPAGGAAAVKNQFNDIELDDLFKDVPPNNNQGHPQNFKRPGQQQNDFIPQYNRPGGGPPPGGGGQGVLVNVVGNNYEREEINAGVEKAMNKKEKDFAELNKKLEFQELWIIDLQNEKKDLELENEDYKRKISKMEEKEKNKAKIERADTSNKNAELEELLREEQRKNKELEISLNEERGKIKIEYRDKTPGEVTAGAGNGQPPYPPPPPQFTDEQQKLAMEHAAGFLKPDKTEIDLFGNVDYVFSTNDIDFLSTSYLDDMKNYYENEEDFYNKVPGHAEKRLAPGKNEPEHRVKQKEKIHKKIMKKFSPGQLEFLKTKSDTLSEKYNTLEIKLKKEEESYQKEMDELKAKHEKEYKTYKDERIKRAGEFVGEKMSAVKSKEEEMKRVFEIEAGKIKQEHDRQVELLKNEHRLESEKKENIIREKEKEIQSIKSANETLKSGLKSKIDIKQLAYTGKKEADIDDLVDWLTINAAVIEGSENLLEEAKRIKEREGNRRFAAEEFKLLIKNHLHSSEKGVYVSKKEAEYINKILGTGVTEFTYNKGFSNDAREELEFVKRIVEKLQHELMNAYSRNVSYLDDFEKSAALNFLKSKLDDYIKAEYEIANDYNNYHLGKQLEKSKEYETQIGLNKQEINSLRQQLKESEFKLTEANSNLSKFNYSKVDNDKQVNILESKINSLNQLLEEKQRNINELSLNRNTNIEKINQLETELFNTRQEIEKLSSHLKNIGINNNEINNQKNQIQNEYNKLYAEYEAISASLKKKEIESNQLYEQLNNALISNKSNVDRIGALTEEGNQLLLKYNAKIEENMKLQTLYNESIEDLENIWNTGTIKVMGDIYSHAHQDFFEEVKDIYTKKGKAQALLQIEKDIDGIKRYYNRAKEVILEKYPLYFSIDTVEGSSVGNNYSKSEERKEMDVALGQFREFYTYLTILHDKVEKTMNYPDFKELSRIRLDRQEKTERILNLFSMSDREGSEMTDSLTDLFVKYFKKPDVSDSEMYKAMADGLDETLTKYATMLNGHDGVDYFRAEFKKAITEGRIISYNIPTGHEQSVYNYFNDLADILYGFKVATTESEEMEIRDQVANAIENLRHSKQFRTIHQKTIIQHTQSLVRDFMEKNKEQLSKTHVPVILQQTLNEIELQSRSSSVESISKIEKGKDFIKSVIKTIKSVGLSGVNLASNIASEILTYKKGVLGYLYETGDKAFKTLNSWYDAIATGVTRAAGASANFILDMRDMGWNAMGSAMMSTAYFVENSIGVMNKFSELVQKGVGQFYEYGNSELLILASIIKKYSESGNSSQNNHVNNAIGIMKEFTKKQEGEEAPRADLNSLGNEGLAQLNKDLLNVIAKNESTPLETKEEIPELLKDVAVARIETIDKEVSSPEKFEEEVRLEVLPKLVDSFVEKAKMKRKKRDLSEEKQIERRGRIIKAILAVKKDKDLKEAIKSGTISRKQAIKQILINSKRENLAKQVEEEMNEDIATQVMAMDEKLQFEIDRKKALKLRGVRFPTEEEIAKSNTKPNKVGTNIYTLSDYPSEKNAKGNKSYFSDMEKAGDLPVVVDVVAKDAEGVLNSTPVGYVSLAMGGSLHFK